MTPQSMWIRRNGPIRLGWWALGLLLVLSGRAEATPEDRPTEVAAAEALIRRVLPDHADGFVCRLQDDEPGPDRFGYTADGQGRIVLSGSNGVALAVAFNQYLRRELKVNYSWQATEPLSFQGALSLPTDAVEASCQATERFFLNYCSFGYSLPWWGWEQWERFIDWMAMNGINRPLLQAGQEAVWLRVWQQFGMSEEEVRAYFPGPAHLPWHRMANMDRWGGPLPMSYIEGQQELQVLILERTRTLGMKAILSAFSGHIPPEIARLHPDAKTTRIGAGWGGMAPEYATTFLDPTDPLFSRIQHTFLVEQENFYGTDHLYAADPFNEMDPPSFDPVYLADVARAIYGGMTSADPEARWYQMAWTYYHQKEKWSVGGRMPALLGALPPGRLVMLDYVCEEEEYYRLTENFYGQPFIWNYLGNYGANTHLAAPIYKVSSRLAAALRVPNCVGVGSTLEGLNVNPVIYEMLLEQPWHPDGVLDVDAWIGDHYATLRCGREDPAVAQAWRRLAVEVLVDDTKPTGRHGVVFQCKPPLSGPGGPSRIEAYTHIDYDPSALIGVLDTFWEAEDESRRADGFSFDAVNLVRQALGNHGRVLYEQAVDAYSRSEVMAFRQAAEAFMAIGDDLDELLGTRHEFLLGPWIEQARAWGSTPAEADYYEMNAREIITAWHGSGARLEDYASRQYSGLMSTYYMPRWAKFFSLAEQAMVGGEPFPEAEFSAWCNEMSRRWIRTTGEDYPTRPIGEPVTTAERLFGKHRSALATQHLYYVQ